MDVKETPKAAAAYALYEQMGPERSLRAVADKSGTKLAQLGVWSSKYEWVARASAYDAAQREKQRAAAAKTDAERDRRRLERERRREADRERMDDERAELMQATWRKTLAKINVKLDAGDQKGLMGLVQLLKHAMDEERTSRGLEPSKQQVDITTNGQTVQMGGISLEQLLTLQQTLQTDLLAWRKEHGYDGGGAAL